MKQEAFEAGYEYLVSDDPGVRNFAVMEIAKMSMMSNDLESSPSTDSQSQEHVWYKWEVVSTDQVLSFYQEFGIKNGKKIILVWIDPKISDFQMHYPRFKKQEYEKMGRRRLSSFWIFSCFFSF